jgi:hypothetical protein
MQASTQSSVELQRRSGARRPQVASLEGERAADAREAAHGERASAAQGAALAALLDAQLGHNRARTQALREVRLAACVLALRRLCRLWAGSGVQPGHARRTRPLRRSADGGRGAA